MAELSGFFPDVSGDREYTTDFLAKWIASFISNGVYNGSLAVTAGSNMQIIIPAGQAWINGYYYKNDSDLTLTITNADGVLKRKDTVVLRWDINSRSITVQVLAGTFASEPVAPPIVRTAEQYDLKLAEIDIAAGATSITQANITDTRLDNNVCGIVHAAVDHINTTALYNQIQADLAEFKSTNETDFTAWVNSLKDILDANTAGHLQNEIDSHMSDYVRQPGYGVDSGTANIYAVALTPVPTSYVDGMGVIVKIANANTGASTLNVNSLGAKAIKNPDGTALSSGDLVAGGIYSFKYNSTTSSFILVGKGGGPNKVGSNTIITPSTVDQAFPKGYYGGALTDGKVKGEPNLANLANWNPDISLFGMQGTSNRKRWATGNNATNSSGAFSVSGLAFTPKTIVMKRIELSNTVQSTAAYESKTNLGTSSYDVNVGVDSVGSSSANLFTITTNGFSFNGGTRFSSMAIYWFACE